MNRNFLKNEITLFRKDGSSVKFYIKASVGSGASCVVYHTISDDNIEHLLKEYYPRNLDLERTSDGTIVIPPHLQEKFYTGLERFRRGYERQKTVRLLENLKNSTSNVQGYFYGNGTEYIDMTIFSGCTYDNIKNETLHSLMLRMRELAQEIGHYHKSRLLHLDIKPQNIFVLDDTQSVKGLMLFDFDSVVEKESIEVTKENAMCVHPLSYTKDWAAPEQLLSHQRNFICEATDLFSIGEIIFTKIYGRHSMQAERRSFADYDIDRNADIFRDVNPKVIPLIKKLFQHTICAVPSKRYQTADELIANLNAIIDILASPVPYLISNINVDRVYVKSPPKSLLKIHEKLQNEGRYFNKSTPKRNVSKNTIEYIKYFSEYYESILLLDCGGGLVSMIESITSIKNFVSKPSIKPIYEQIFDVMESLCNESTLIVIQRFHEGCLVDDEYFDMQDVVNICRRLTGLRATILIDGSFDTSMFEKYHWNYYYSLLKKLSEFCHEKSNYYDAELYIKKAMKVSSECDDGYELWRDARKFWDMIRFDWDWDLPIIDEDERELDEILWFYRRAVWKYGQK